jgi:hypothetical protein
VLVDRIDQLARLTGSLTIVAAFWKMAMIERSASWSVAEIDQRGDSIAAPRSAH